MKKSLGKRGFTAIEILSAVAVVSILAALAIPHIIKVRMGANEAAAQTALRTIGSAMAAYHLEKATYPSDLTELAPGRDTPVNIEANVANGLKLGYRFEVASADQDTYQVIASPQNPQGTGRYLFILTETGIIQKEDTAITSGTSGATNSTGGAAAAY